MKQLEQLAMSIKDKQAELELVRNEGNLEATTQIEREIDELQKQYNNLKTSGTQSPFPELKIAQADASIDEQIEYMEHLVKTSKEYQDRFGTNPLVDTVRLRHGILKSLLAIRMIRETGATIMSELKTALSLPEEVMKGISRPYDLENQLKFVIALADELGDPSTDLQRELSRMYDSLIETINVGMWVAAATADRLTRLPGNHAPTNDEQAIQQVNEGDSEIYIAYDQVDGTYLATFNDWCDNSDIAGHGATAEEAVSKLFKEKDKKRQGILFPEGGDHE